MSEASFYCFLLNHLLNYRWNSLLKDQIKAFKSRNLVLKQQIEGEIEKELGSNDLLLLRTEWPEWNGIREAASRLAQNIIQSEDGIQTSIEFIHKSILDLCIKSGYEEHVDLLNDTFRRYLDFIFVDFAALNELVIPELILKPYISNKLIKTPGPLSLTKIIKGIDNFSTSSMFQCRMRTHYVDCSDDFFSMVYAVLLYEIQQSRQIMSKKISYSIHRKDNHSESISSTSFGSDQLHESIYNYTINEVLIKMLLHLKKSITNKLSMDHELLEERTVEAVIAFKAEHKTDLTVNICYDIHNIWTVTMQPIRPDPSSREFMMNLFGDEIHINPSSVIMEELNVENVVEEEEEDLNKRYAIAECKDALSLTLMDILLSISENGDLYSTFQRKENKDKLQDYNRLMLDFVQTNQREFMDRVKDNMIGILSNKQTRENVICRLENRHEINRTDFIEKPKKKKIKSLFKVLIKEKNI